MSEQKTFIAGGDWDKWDKEEHITDPAETKTYFGKMRLFLNLKVKRFQKGKHFILPGVLNYPRNEAGQTNGPPTGPLEFRGMVIDAESNDYIHFIVIESLNADDETYQHQRRYNSWVEKDDETGEKRPNGWNDYQKEEFFKLSQTNRKEVGDTGKISFDKPDVPEAWVYAKFDLLPTNYTYQFDYKTYVGNIAIFANESEMKKAEQEWRSQFNNGENSGQQDKDYSHYPLMWQKKPQALAKYAQKQNDAGKSYKEIALICKLIDENGNPSTTPNDDKVNVVALLAELLDVPEPMVTLE